MYRVANQTKHLKYNLKLFPFPSVDNTEILTQNKTLEIFYIDYYIDMKRIQDWVE